MPTKNGRVRGATNELVSAARELRVGQTQAEQMLWSAVRGRKLDGFKFRRQYSIGSHILDFVCVERRLVVELDGAHHGDEENRRYDQDRTEHLQQYGYRVLRFPNEVVLNDLDTVLDDIRIVFVRGHTPS